MWRFFPLLLLITACNTPTLQFRDAPVRTLTVGKSTFDVRMIHGQIQAIRTNMEWAPNWKHTISRFHTAMERATNCKVDPKKMRGDQTIMIAPAKC